MVWLRLPPPGAAVPQDRRAVRKGLHVVDQRGTAEIADLWFHCLVVLVKHGLGPADVCAELARREGMSGLQEKAVRM